MHKEMAHNIGKIQACRKKQEHMLNCVRGLGETCRKDGENLQGWPGPQRYRMTYVSEKKPPLWATTVLWGPLSVVKHMLDFRVHWPRRRSTAI